ncbi:MAG: cellulose binding domain-containing protein, partial [Pseudomonadota bacterium]
PAGDVQVVPQVYAPPPKPAVCNYTVGGQWWGGGWAVVRINNTSSTTIHGWQASWTYADDSTVGTVYNAVLTGTAPSYTVNDAGWNADIAPGATSEVYLYFSQGTQDPLPAPVVSGTICQ